MQPTEESDQIEELDPEYLHQQNKPAYHNQLIRPSPRPSRRPSEESLQNQAKLHQSPTPNIQTVSSDSVEGSNRSLPDHNPSPPPPTISLTNQWPPAPYGDENLPKPAPKRKSSSSALTHNRPIKLLASSSSTNDPKPSRFSFDFNNSSHINTRDSQRISSNETVKQHLIRRQKEKTDEEEQEEHPQKITVAPSITLSLFTHLTDPTLSWKTKLGCFGATLGINFFLPFINGVMLGFGEIAARELLGAYFGWGPAGYRYHSKQLPQPSNPSEASEHPSPSDPSSTLSQSPAGSSVSFTALPSSSSSSST
ncbi:hypothetical protein PGT21_028945 [Puccinia graminis f. sp. tritici]|uniref:Uncharacterized protein n=1 Tax=Puccinia graminis f. sp. tritici TaxID=56615 RepID=A0A5B0QQ33_PUCGR|nr:hypothetical protein PGT21_028945 [Puccinia graminis f. sp. tritici]